MKWIISNLIVLSVALFFFKREWFKAFWRWIFKIFNSMIRFIFTKGLKAIGWFLIRIFYWLGWLIWESILLFGRAIGALFNVFAKR